MPVVGLLFSFNAVCAFLLYISYVTGIYQEWADPNRSLKQDRVISKLFTESGQLKNLFLQADATCLKPFLMNTKAHRHPKNF